MIIDLRRSMNLGPGPKTKYVAGCPHCQATFVLSVHLFQFTSRQFDDWMCSVIKHRAACHGLNESGRHHLNNELNLETE